jgi:pyridoxine kinase
MRFLSIQSFVAYGHVGNSAATFPLQRLGHEVWPVNTVHFSNHTGYGDWRGVVFEPATVADLIEGIADRGVLGTADAVLTGYQGSPGVAAVVLATVERIRSQNPELVYCCDPVMGDVGRGMFVLPGIPQLMREQVVPAADIVTPNAYELSYLAGSGGDPATATRADVSTVEGVLAAAEKLRALGPRTVLVTSVEHTDLPDDEIAMVALDDQGAWLVSTPRLPVSVNGAGDVTAALFLAHLGAGTDVALGRVAATVFAVLEATVTAGSREIRLIDAQESIAFPPDRFRVRRL